MTDSVPPYAYCSGCKKPSWNQRDIAYAKWKWGKYMCLACSPMTQKPPVKEVSAEVLDPTKTVYHDTQKPHQSDEAFAQKIVPVNLQGSVEPVYQRPEEEVKQELVWLGDVNNRIEDIPF